MKIEPNKKIQIINRITPKREDRKNFFTMDRNERVDDFSTVIIKKALSQISSYDLRTYPDSSEIYNKLSILLIIFFTCLSLTKSSLSRSSSVAVIYLIESI